MIERQAGAVKRYHTVSTIKTQTVGEHSFNMCMILYKLVDEPSANLLKAVLFHDLPEIITGDIPATAKWNFPSLDQVLSAVESVVINENNWDVELTEEEKKILKYADMIELVMFAKDELSLGNSNMRVIFDRGVRYLEDMPRLVNDEIRDRIQKMVNDLCADVYFPGF